MIHKDIRIYEWEVNVKDYEWLKWMEEHYGKFDEPFRRSVRFGALWRPRVLVRSNNQGRQERPISDTPKTQHSAMRLLSRRSLSVLRDLIEASCEILPMESSLGEFWGINCLVESDCLDFKKSRYRRDPQGRVAQVYDWAFDSHRVPPVHVFRVPHSCTTFLVTQEFVDRVWKAKLLGFRLNLLWSLYGGPIEHQDAINGTDKDITEPWEKAEIKRLKSELRRRTDE